MKKLMEKLGISIDPRINLGALLTAIIGFFALIYAIFGGQIETFVRLHFPELEWNPPKAEIFSATLEDLSSVKNAGGTPLLITEDKNFKEGGWGKGFISLEAGEAIEFKTKGNFYRKQGTVALCVALDRDLAQAKDELFLFSTYARDYDAVVLQLIEMDMDTKSLRRVALMRVKRKISDREIADEERPWINAFSQELEWKAGEYHHLAGTWGKEGVKLYIDGKRVGYNPIAPARPTRTNHVFTLNNDTAVDVPNNPTHCILRNLQIFNYPLSDAEVKEIYRKHLEQVE